MKTLLALISLLAFLGAPNPVLCLEREGACGGGPGADPGLASCHDQSPASIPDCESCTDVAAPEESLVRANHSGHAREIPPAGLRLSIVAGILPAIERSSSVLSAARPGSTLPLIRTTVLLI